MRSNVSIINSNSGPNSRFQRLQDQVVGIKYDNNAPNSRRPFCEATSLSSQLVRTNGTLYTVYTVRTRVVHVFHGTNGMAWYVHRYHFWYHGTSTRGRPVAPECLYFKSFLR